jgi:hypothetical protein
MEMRRLGGGLGLAFVVWLVDLYVESRGVDNLVEIVGWVETR